MKQQRSAKAAEWNAKHPDAHRRHSREYSAKNREALREKNKKWHKANREWNRNYSREYRKQEPEKHKVWIKRWAQKDPVRTALVRRTSKTNHRAAKKLNGGRASSAEIAHLFKMQRSRCAGCGTGGKLTIDHIVPVSKGGTSNPSNLQLLCISCNRSKSDKDALVWAREHGRLL